MCNVRCQLFVGVMSLSSFNLYMPNKPVLDLCMDYNQCWIHLHHLHIKLGMATLSRIKE